MALEVHSFSSLPRDLDLFRELAQLIRDNQRTGSGELPRNKGSHFHKPEVPTRTEAPRSSSKDVEHYRVKVCSCSRFQGTRQSRCAQPKHAWAGRKSGDSHALCYVSACMSSANKHYVPTAPCTMPGRYLCPAHFALSPSRLYAGFSRCIFTFNAHSL